MYSTKDFKGGLKIEWDGTPYEIIEASHYKPGKGGAFVRTKLRNMLTGGIVENNFRSGEKVGKPDMETRAMQYLYKDGDDYVFMDMNSYEQVHITEEQASDKGGYLKDGQEAKVLFYNGQPLDLEIPVSTVLEVAETEPGVKGDTVSSTFKPAVMETGITIQVPLFINIGDRIKIDTRSGNYLGREGSA